MKKRRTFLTATARSVLLGFALLALIIPNAAAAEKDRLTFAAISTEEVAVVAERWQGALKYIAKNVGVEIDYYTTTSYAAAVEAMISGFVDFAELGPRIYIIAREKAPFIEAINGTGRAPTPWRQEVCACYYGRLITKKGGQFTTIESLEGAVVSFTDPGSTSGDGLPRALFPDAIGGRSVDDYFGKIVYAGSHEAAARSVVAGMADAAFVSEQALSRMVHRAVFEADVFDFLWTSPAIVSNPIVVNTRTMSKEMIGRLHKVLLEMGKTPEGQRLLKQLKIVGLPALTDAKFDPLRRILAVKEKSK